MANKKSESGHLYLIPDSNENTVSILSLGFECAQSRMWALMCILHTNDI